MSKEFKNNVLTNLVTFLAIGIMSALGVWANSEIETYEELKEALPEIREINKAKAEIEAEYLKEKKQTNQAINLLKKRCTELEINNKKPIEESQKDKQQDEWIDNLRRLRSKDSSAIYWSYSWVKHWKTQNNE